MHRILTDPGVGWGWFSLSQGKSACILACILALAPCSLYYLAFDTRYSNAVKVSDLSSALPAHDACQLVYRILADPDVEWCLLVVTKHSGAVNFSGVPIASPAHDARRPEYRILTEPDVELWPFDSSPSPKPQLADTCTQKIMFDQWFIPK